MLQNFIVSVLIFLFSGVFAIAFGQTAAVKPSVISGDVVAVSEKAIVLNVKTTQVEVGLTDKTEFKRVSPINPSLQVATAAALTDVAVGDKLMVTGILAADGKSIPARAVYLMTKSDISKKNAKEAEEWRTRGIAGKVLSVNSQTNQINLEIRGLTGSSNVMLTPKENAKFKRYAQDSVRFDEAKDSSLAEVKTGDMIRALGDKSTDGASFAAEQVVAGAFQTIAGTVKSVDASKNEVLITDLQTKKDVTVVIGDTSVLKRFPAEMAEGMARMQMMGAGGARPVGGAQPPQQPRPAPTVGQGQTPGGAGRPGMGGQRPGSGGLDDMLERLPGITAADLKAGDMIAISSTRNGSAARVKAIKLVAGVEPFLRLAQTGNGGRRGQGGVDAGFSIPGLDGIGFP